MIRNIILDIGQVLADFESDRFIRKLGFEEEKANRLIQATVVDQEQWNQHDKGCLSDEEFIQQVLAKDPGIETELRCFFAHICDIVTEYDYAEGFVKQLKQSGYKVYLLSNYGSTTFAAAEERFRFLKHVDGAVISSRIQMIKPSKGIYQYLLEKYHLSPDECVFIDDREVNLEPARDMGFQTIHFHNLSQTKQQLQNLGVCLTGE